MVGQRACERRSPRRVHVRQCVVEMKARAIACGDFVVQATALWMHAMSSSSRIPPRPADPSSLLRHILVLIGGILRAHTGARMSRRESGGAGQEAVPLGASTRARWCLLETSRASARLKRCVWGRTPSARELRSSTRLGFPSHRPSRARQSFAYLRFEVPFVFSAFSVSFACAMWALQAARPSIVRHEPLESS